MKLAELIARAQSLKPSEYDKDDMTQWVNGGRYGFNYR